MVNTYQIVPLVCLCLPILSALSAIAAGRRRRSMKPIRSFVGICATGVIVGVGLVFLYDVAIGGQAPVSQVIITCYWVTAALCLVRWVSVLSDLLLSRLLRPRPSQATGRPLGPGIVAAAVTGGILRALLVFCVGAAVLLATALTFRPKLPHPGNPQTLYQLPFDTVEFSSTDGITLRGWWIPSARVVHHGSQPGPTPGQETILFCPGFGADKASQLLAVRDLVLYGYNVFAIDLRAHGESGGQLTTFGNLERRDVLGAVAWLRAHRQKGAKRILGLGVNAGAAALIGAAADPGEDGQAIEAIAAIDPFNRITDLVQAVAERHVVPVSGWLAVNIAIPLAGAEVGTDLSHWSCGHDVQMLWPRPLLVIGGNTERTIPTKQSQELFDQAMQPKYIYWIDTQASGQLIGSRQASLALRVFFAAAQPIL